MYREIRALRKLHHQHICQMFQIVETDKMIHLVLEVRCSGCLVLVFMQVYVYCSSVLVVNYSITLLLRNVLRFDRLSDRIFH